MTLATRFATPLSQTPSTPAATPANARWWREPFVAPKALGRVEAIDLARGFAVVLMILSHGVKGLAAWLKPVTLIGSDALQAFIFHISVIFLLFRLTLGYWREIDYLTALALTLGLIIATAGWIWLVHHLTSKLRAS